MKTTTQNKGKESFLNLLEALGLAYWVEIITTNPPDFYYFGPFSSAKEAEIYQGGFIQDILDDGIEIIAVHIKRCHSPKLT
ncbi:MAG TPA: hypothetical protein DDW51_10990 [Cyanobacteria bacterium UBA11367]|nr:hypothetical protein [Cyanobacteria bacterium UBA11367]HBE56470.1 hypothetical protein [Cyanobacteria bacterium UBA11366]HBK66854.1 hypothetical protein [Cyanobacteria bacterium UBA11166]HCA96322.1 hypothetical protein [Cyanobacteria bacterium UBA9226]